ncbi:unnamed protein product [Hymenolepis diminuta]|uniref:Uncharacterized protein n=1 Tax=Hymenolepis diminuta TaxID=6216 RepID=A0A564Y3Y8_HYMDI|nr:unnamed protein product [Hymenolepis diminuta]
MYYFADDYDHEGVDWQLANKNIRYLNNSAEGLEEEDDYEEDVDLAFELQYLKREQEKTRRRGYHKYRMFPGTPPANPPVTVYYDVKELKVRGVPTFKPPAYARISRKDQSLPPGVTRDAYGVECGFLRRPGSLPPTIPSSIGGRYQQRTASLPPSKQFPIENQKVEKCSPKKLTMSEFEGVAGSSLLTEILSPTQPEFHSLSGISEEKTEITIQISKNRSSSEAFDESGTYSTPSGSLQLSETFDDLTLFTPPNKSKRPEVISGSTVEMKTPAKQVPTSSPSAQSPGSSGSRCFVGQSHSGLIATLDDINTRMTMIQEKILSPNKTPEEAARILDFYKQMNLLYRALRLPPFKMDTSTIKECERIVSPLIPGSSSTSDTSPGSKEGFESVKTSTPKQISPGSPDLRDIETEINERWAELEKMKEKWLCEKRAEAKAEFEKRWSKSGSSDSPASTSRGGLPKSSPMNRSPNEEGSRILETSQSYCVGGHLLHFSSINQNESGVMASSSREQSLKLEASQGCEAGSWQDTQISRSTNESVDSSSREHSRILETSEKYEVPGCESGFKN